MERATAVAVEQYRTLAKMEQKVRMAEEKLHDALLAVPEDEMDQYLRLTQEIDRAASDFEQNVDRKGLSEATRRSYLSTYLNGAGRV